jgi:hypothetical protein
MATTVLLSIVCLLVLGIYVLLGYLAWILVREYAHEEDQPGPLASLHADLKAIFGPDEANLSARARMEKRWEHLKKPALAPLDPLVEWTAELTSAMRAFDERFEIKASGGEVLGACGVRFAPLEGYNMASYDRLLEVWLEESGGERASKFMASRSLLDEGDLKEKLEGQGEVVEDTRGLRIETQALYIEVVPDYFYYDQPYQTWEGETIEWSQEFAFSIWRKGLLHAEERSAVVSGKSGGKPAAAPSNAPIWTLPDPAQVLEAIPRVVQDKKLLAERVKLLEATLENFGAPGKVVDLESSPYNTTFVVTPRAVERRGGRRAAVLMDFKRTADDIARALELTHVRVRQEAEGKRIRIETPNQSRAANFHQIIASQAWREFQRPLKFPLGHGKGGQPVVSSLDELYSILVAGMPGTALDAWLDTLICALLLQHSPAEFRLALIGSQRRGFQEYSGLPHLWTSVAGEGAGRELIQQVFEEFERREAALEEAGVFELRMLNALLDTSGEPRLPWLVLIASELGDLFNEHSGWVDDHLIRLAQVGVRSGVHVVAASQQTERGLTEVLLPRVEAKLTFAVRNIKESRTFNAFLGAERLTDPYEYLLNGPGLLMDVRYRLAPVSEGEIARIVNHWRDQAAPG